MAAKEPDRDCVTPDREVVVDATSALAAGRCGTCTCRGRVRPRVDGVVDGRERPGADDTAQLVDLLAADRGRIAATTSAHGRLTSLLGRGLRGGVIDGEVQPALQAARAQVLRRRARVIAVIDVAIVGVAHVDVAIVDVPRGDVEQVGIHRAGIDHAQRRRAGVVDRLGAVTPPGGVDPLHATVGEEA